MLLAGIPETCAQDSPFDSALREEASQIAEVLHLYTDRSLYVTDDVLRFSAYIEAKGPVYASSWSSVMYVEFISAGGNSLVSKKCPIHGGRAYGEIVLPDNINSGNYYLRSYTRWMRNRGPESYSYVPVKVINPYRSELEKEIPVAESELSLSSLPSKESALYFGPHPEMFSRGEELSLQLLLREGVSFVQGCISVVPHSARPQLWVTSRQYIRQKENEGPESDFKVSFLPDKFGPSISGSVITADGGTLSASGSKIHLTLMGEHNDYLVSEPDAAGRFSIALPFYSGQQELFIQARDAEGSTLVVRVDREFDQRHLALPAPSFELSEDERKVATIMARNKELGELYIDKGSGIASDSTMIPVPFYGNPARSVDLDRFVLLPTLEEVFVNLVPGVSLVKRRKGMTLQIDSDNPAFSMFEPLIMVDQVPVFDLEKFMALSPSKIRRIDVIDDVYVKGDMRYGGVVNLQSRDGDMAGIDLPANSFFIDIQNMNPPSAKAPEHVSGEGNMPDIRNTQLWLPQLSIRKGDTLPVSFRAPEYPGEYTILFRGVDQDGEVVIAESSFKVPERK